MNKMENVTELIMAEFNLSDASYESLPRGMAKDLYALIQQRNTIEADLKKTQGELDTMLGIASNCDMALRAETATRKSIEAEARKLREALNGALAWVPYHAPQWEQWAALAGAAAQKEKV